MFSLWAVVFADCLWVLPPSRLPVWTAASPLPLAPPACATAITCTFYSHAASLRGRAFFRCGDRRSLAPAIFSTGRAFTWWRRLLLPFYTTLHRALAVVRSIFWKDRDVATTWDGFSATDCSLVVMVFVGFGFFMVFALCGTTNTAFTDGWRRCGQHCAFTRTALAHRTVAINHLARTAAHRGFCQQAKPFRGRCRGYGIAWDRF